MNNNSRRRSINAQGVLNALLDEESSLDDDDSGELGLNLSESQDPLEEVETDPLEGEILPENKSSDEIESDLQMEAFVLGHLAIPSNSPIGNPVEMDNMIEILNHDIAPRIDYDLIIDTMTSQMPSTTE